MGLDFGVSGCHFWNHFLVGFSMGFSPENHQWNSQIATCSPTGLLGPSNCARWAERVIRFFLTSLGLAGFSKIWTSFQLKIHTEDLKFSWFLQKFVSVFCKKPCFGQAVLLKHPCILEKMRFCNNPGTKDPWWAALLQHWYLEILDELSTRAEWICITCIREKVPYSPGAFVWPTLDATVPWLMGEWEVNLP